ncbi:LysR substrate-binding domain-containing protein, partial [Acinetobacter baumannii]
STSDAAIEAALLGLGLTRVLCYQIASALLSGALVKVLEPYEPEPFPVSLVYSAQGLLPIKLRAFLDFAAPRIKARLNQL